MTVFYINEIKNQETDEEYLDKYDIAKFIDGTSNVPNELKKKVRILTQGKIVQ